MSDLMFVFMTILLVLGESTNIAVGQQKQSKPKPPAYLDSSTAPLTYWLQGEFYGQARLKASSPFSSYGLQVIDKGKSAFEAVLFPGGLPGEGWNKQDPLRLSGIADGHQVVFAKDEFVLTVDVDSAKVEPADWQPAADRPVWGSLKKFQRISPTLGLKPPAGSQVLFDGTATDLWSTAQVDGELLKEGAMTKNSYQDFRLHLEFQIAFKPEGTDQDRGNSGVYIQRRYELQILDSFGRELQFNDIGSIYRQQKPELNMALPPLSWQTYDIWFRAPRFDAKGEKTENARITVWLNGVPIHDDYEIIAKTGAGQKEAPHPLPINLQDHQNPIRFRNIWLIEGDIKPPAPLTTGKASSSIASKSLTPHDAGREQAFRTPAPVARDSTIIRWGPYAMPLEQYYQIGQPGWVPPPPGPVVGYGHHWPNFGP